ncbi:MAG TPA: hypothetical protein VHW01_10555 [Polyangiaceae bacterium]|nr:hypothetical protein [Polyangiaceae bacterium]
MLPPDTAGASAAGTSATEGVSGAANAGDSAGGASGAKELDAGTGKGGNRNGMGGFHGGAGASTTQPGGSGNQDPCLAGDQCVDGGLDCPPTATQGVCKRCTKDWECADQPDAPFCDAQDGRCAECLRDDQCQAGYVCHRLTLRCMHSCNTSADCVFDRDKPQCDGFHTCVSCIVDTDCHEITGHQNDVCAFGTCADCYDDTQCPPQRQYCVGLVCQTKR